MCRFNVVNKNDSEKSIIIDKLQHIMDFLIKYFGRFSIVSQLLRNF